MHDTETCVNPGFPCPLYSPSDKGPGSLGQTLVFCDDLLSLSHQLQVLSIAPPILILKFSPSPLQPWTTTESSLIFCKPPMPLQSNVYGPRLMGAPHPMLPSFLSGSLWPTTEIRMHGRQRRPQPPSMPTRLQPLNLTSPESVLTHLALTHVP